MNVLLLIYSSLTSHYARTLTYMLQRVDYQPEPFIRWLFRAGNLRNVQKRGAVNWTFRAKAVYGAIVSSVVTYLLVNLLIIYALDDFTGRVGLALIASLAYPFIIVVIITIIITFGRVLIVSPKERAAIKRAKAVYGMLPAHVVAVAGSYGKTTMKELLLHLLSGQYKTRATIANANTLGSIAALAPTIEQDIEYVVVEYGEAYPGDILKATEMTKPEYAFITGLAPNHLDHYNTLDALTQDIGYLVGYLDPCNVYVNGDCDTLTDAIPMGIHYGHQGAGNLHVTDINTQISGTTIKFTYKKTRHTFTTRLLGAHNVGPLMAVVEFCTGQGMAIETVLARLTELEPHEHRMSVRPLGHNSWFIDDTYNGNVNGLLAGLELLASLPATGKKIYITPGLVDQGSETKSVHETVGQAIAKTSPDEVILFDNSVRTYIENAALQNGYKGTITVVGDAIELANSLDSITAAGDVVLWQNDWPDEYN